MTVNPFWFGFLVGTIVTLIILVGIAYVSAKKKGDKDDNGKAD